MKTAISRFVVVAAIAALVGGVTPVLAQITFTDFSTPTGLQLNGNAAAPVTNGTGAQVLRLTPNVQDQAGSAWFTTLQPVAGTFSTTFTFQLSGSTNTGFGPADGFAFVIQNSSATPATALAALGPDGCSIGFGGNPTCQGTGSGITNSVAVEFDTYANTDDPSNNHVSIQSCPSHGANSTDSGVCRIADNNLSAGTQIFLADENPHTASISFAPSGSCTNAACPGLMHVVVDTIDLFPGGVSFDIASIGLTGTGTAYVGFTAATGGGDINQDVLNWTFTPQQQSGSIVAGAATPTVLNYSGGPTNGNNANTGYEYDLQLDSTEGNNHNPNAVTGNVTAIVMDQKSCNKIVQKSFPLTQCFVFQNADGKGNSGAVFFSLTCPNFDGTTTSNCGDTTSNDFAAALGTKFTFLKSQNLFFQLLNLTIGPYPGWLKGDGGVTGFPCMINPTNPSAPLFQSNQITSFSVTGDPLGTTKGKSGGSGSCWTATYATFGEVPPGVHVSIPPTPPTKVPTYAKNQVVTATYTCSTPTTSQDPTVSAVGPYLTVNSCQQASGSQTSCTTSSSGMACSGTIDTSRTGLLKAFAVTSKDTGGNVGANAAFYNVH